MDKYDVVKTLGTGAYGEAILVTTRSDGQPRSLVVKLVRTEHLSEQDMAKALQEAEVLRKMSHSNIICCVESFVEDGKVSRFWDWRVGWPRAG